MAHDRIIPLREKKPTEAQLLRLLRAYLAGAGHTEYKANRYFANLEGDGTYLNLLMGRPEELTRKGRFFEVILIDDGDDPHVDVITRQADPYTKAVADGFFHLLERHVAMDWPSP